MSPGPDDGAHVGARAGEFLPPPDPEPTEFGEACRTLLSRYRDLVRSPRSLPWHAARDLSLALRFEGMIERLAACDHGTISLSPMERVLELVAEERQRQDRKWGQQNHELPHWMLILGEEVGEAQKAVLERAVLLRDGPTSADPEAELRSRTDDVRSELIQVAAVAVAILECMDRCEAISEVAP